MKEHEIDPIQKAICELSREEQTRIESELRSIFELAYNPGIESILEAASLLGIDHFAARLPTGVGVYYKSIWTRLNYPAIFEKALRIHSFETLSWWRKRKDLPTVEFQEDDPLEAKLGEALSELF